MEVRFKVLKLCECCSKEYKTYEKNSKYCGSSCAAKINNTNRPPRSKKSRDKTRIANEQSGSLFGQNPDRDTNNKQKYIENCESRRVIKICPHCNTNFLVPPSDTKKYCSLECSKHYSGGERKNSGRSKSGYYEGLYCQSSYEFAFVYVYLKNGAKIERNTKGFPYKDENGVERKYYPDYIVDGIYTEIKGWITSKDKCKFRNFPYQLNVIVGDEMKYILTEAETISGVSRTMFCTLYGARDNDVYTGETSICQHCSVEFKSKVPKLSTNMYCSRVCAGKARAKIREEKRKRKRKNNGAP